MSEKEVENEEFTEFAQTALREPRKGVFEEMLALHLVNSTINTKPSQIISHVAAAAMMVQQKDVEGLDLELLKTIYAVNNALNNPYEHKFDKANSMTRIYFGFENSKENFEKYIKPWFVNFRYYTQYISSKFLCSGYKVKHQDTVLLTQHDRTCNYVFATVKEEELAVNSEEKEWFEARFKFPMVCPKCRKQVYDSYHLYFEPTPLIDNTQFELFFFEACQCLTGEGYTMLLNSFTLWAMPIVQKAKAELAKLVTPTLYQEMLKMLKPEAEPRESGLGSTE